MNELPEGAEQVDEKQIGIKAGLEANRKTEEDEEDGEAMPDVVIEPESRSKAEISVLNVEDQPYSPQQIDPTTETSNQKLTPYLMNMWCYRDFVRWYRDVIFFKMFEILYVINFSLPFITLLAVGNFILCISLYCATRHATSIKIPFIALGMIVTFTSLIVVASNLFFYLGLSILYWWNMLYLVAGIFMFLQTGAWFIQLLSTLISGGPGRNSGQQGQKKAELDVSTNAGGNSMISHNMSKLDSSMDRSGQPNVIDIQVPTPPSGSYESPPLSSTDRKKKKIKRRNKE